tara:strand:+ start:13588 stop:14163 length:576 start_codon:yes stop_codon:yes gene_type:complete
MALAKAYNGAVPVRKRGSSYNTMGTNKYQIANTYGDNIFRGDLVKVSAGYIQPVSVTADRPIGVFQGSQFVDPTSKQPTWLNYWPSGTSSADGKAYAHVMDDPDGIYQMQCNATVTIGDLETQNFFVEVSDGNTYTGQSAWAVQVTSRTSLANPLRIVGLWEVEGNDWNQANTRVLVRISNHLDYAASIAN